MNRPPPPARLPSYSKRHASFDSPREVPLPSPLSPRDSRELGSKVGYFDLPKERDMVERDHRDELRKEYKDREQRERERDEKSHSRLSQHSPHRSKESNYYHTPHHSLDKAPSPLHTPSHSLHSSPQPFQFEPSFKSSLDSETPKSTGEPVKQPVFPHPRPYSLPHSSPTNSGSGSGSSGSGHASLDGASGVGVSGVHTFGGQSVTGAGSQRETGTIDQINSSKVDGYSPKPAPYFSTGTEFTLGKPDRSSSASLPLPTQIPYHTLPRAQLLSTRSDDYVSENGSSSGGSSESSTSLPSAESLSSTEYPRFRDPFRDPSSPRSLKSPSTFSQPSPSPLSASLPSSPSSYATSNSPAPNHTQSTACSDVNSPLTYLADDDSSTSYMTAMRRPTKAPLSHPPVILEESSPSSLNIARSASTGSSTAQPHSVQRSTSHSIHTQTPEDDSRAEVWRNPPPVQPPRATPSPRPVGGFVNPSDLPPVLPPQRTMSRVGHDSGCGPTQTSGATPSLMNSSFSAPSSTNANPSLSLPHTPLNPHSTTQNLALTANNPPAYAPFLSPLPPPPERCWIEVETTPSAYKLNVRLEGFKRDGITLATRRRRVLHVVADSWDTEGGGHFERRISFGYDADLVGVRAEFDGEWLRIIVPRRTGVT
ncbi:hypothetical protein L218DRAFT_998880 [Marasmius fiardii PR-910]|nr:hypothetical protein L218DRAFT_998880 [Marasmius fiardii PR-910]